MKKGISILVLLAIVATGAFAQGFSVGVGGLFDMSVGNGLKAEAQGIKLTEDLNNMSFGGFVFFDATYAELDANFAYGLATLKAEQGNQKVDADATALQLGFTLLGKYPIGLGGFAIFPLLGADYNLVLSFKDKESGEEYDKPGDWSQIGFLAGLGLDLPFSSALFLRAEALFHLRLPSKFMSDLVDKNKATFNNYGGSMDTTFGMGPRVKIGIGYRF